MNRPTGNVSGRGGDAHGSPPKDHGAFGALLRPGVSLGFYFALALIYFLPAFLPGRHVFGTDYLAASYFYHEWISDLFASGSIPKWLPYVYGGLPWFANPGMTWYPFRFLADLALPVPRIFPAIFVLQATVAGFGTYLLARELGARRWVAFVAGLAFQFTGQLMSFTFAGHDGRMIGMSAGPLFLYFLASGIRTGRIGPFVGASATIGFAMLSFQIQSAYYVLLAGALWSVFLLISGGWHRRPRALGRRVLLGLGAVAVAFALNAVNFLPFMDYVDASPRADGRGYEYAVSYSMAPSHVIAMAVPEQQGILDEYGQRIQRLSSEGHDVSGENAFKLHTEYVGALVIVLTLLGALYARRDRRWLFFLGLAGFALTIAFGDNTPLYRLYYAVLPGTRFFRTPDMAYTLVPLALVAMSAITLESLAKLRETRVGSGSGKGGRGHASKSDDTGPAFSTAAWLIGGFVLLCLIGGGMLGSAPTAAEGAPAGWFRFAVFAGLVGGALWLWMRDILDTRAVAAALALIVIADLWIIDKKFLDTVEDPAVMFAPDAVANFLRTQEEPFRVWVLPPGIGGLPSYRNHTNYLMNFGIEQASGEHGNQLQRWNEYIGAGEEVYADYHNFLEDMQGALSTGAPTRYMGAANIRYVVAMGELPIPGWRLVHPGPDALIYEVPDAMPRAWLAAEVVGVEEEDGALSRMQQAGWNPARTAFVQATGDDDELSLLTFPSAGEPAGVAVPGEVGLIEYESDRVVVRANADRPALLVLANNYYPGWQARIDDREVPIVRTNHTFQGVVVPEGEHRVEFTFRPPNLYRGLAIYLICLALFVGFGAWSAWKWRTRDSRSTTP